MDNNASKSDEVPLCMLEPAINISDPLQVKSEDWTGEEDEDCGIKNLNSKSSEIVYKKQKQLKVRSIDKMKAGNEAEQSYTFSTNQRSHDFDSNKTSSIKYMMNLIDFLKEDSNGKGILNAYQKNGRSLTTAVRKNLVHAIIQREKDEILRDVQVGEVISDWEISRDRFKKLANEIEANFDGESAKTYYMPFSTEQGQKLLASGKLLDHYQYVKRTMRNDGLLVTKFRRNIPDAGVPEIKSVDLSESEKNDLEFLQNHSEPFEEVKNVFLRCHNARRNIFQAQGISIFDYMCSVKALQSNQDGPILIDLDFEILHKGKKSMLFEKWPKLRNYLINLIRKNKAACTENGAYVETLSNESPDVQDILIFYLLHYITMDKKKRKRKDIEDNQANLSSNEMRSTYVLHVKHAGEFDSRLEKLKNSLNATSEKFRSIIAIVGPLRSVEAIYVVVNNIKYQTQSILHAIDLNVKILHVFDYKFTDNVHFFWQFFQTTIYDILNPEDFICMKNRILKGEIQHILKK